MLALIGFLVLVLSVLLVARVWMVLPARVKGATAPTTAAAATKASSRRPAEGPRCKTMVVLGSGGHTAEMLQMMRLVTAQHSPRHYVVATTDTMSASKALAFEEARPTKSEVCSSLWSS